MISSAIRSRPIPVSLNRPSAPVAVAIVIERSPAACPGEAEDGVERQSFQPLPEVAGGAVAGLGDPAGDVAFLVVPDPGGLGRWRRRRAGLRGRRSALRSAALPRRASPPARRAGRRARPARHQPTPYPGADATSQGYMATNPSPRRRLRAWAGGSRTGRRSRWSPWATGRRPLSMYAARHRGTGDRPAVGGDDPPLDFDRLERLRGGRFLSDSRRGYGLRFHRRPGVVGSRSAGGENAGGGEGEGRQSGRGGELDLGHQHLPQKDWVRSDAPAEAGPPVAASTVARINAGDTAAVASFTARAAPSAGAARPRRISRPLSRCRALASRQRSVGTVQRS